MGPKLLEHALPFIIVPAPNWGLVAFQLVVVVRVFLVDGRRKPRPVLDLRLAIGLCWCCRRPHMLSSTVPFRSVAQVVVYGTVRETPTNILTRSAIPFPPPAVGPPWWESQNVLLHCVQ